MKSFSYKIIDEIGIHARPAGLLVKEAKEFESEITIRVGDRAASAKKLMAVMGLNVKCGNIVVVEIEGSDEDAALDRLRKFFEGNL